MSSSLRQLIEQWDGLAVLSRFDAATEAWIFVALHDDRLGTPTGGTRMKVYARPEDGLVDAMRLAEGMTHKWAAIDLRFGGGKAVLALSRELEPQARTGLLQCYGAILRGLKGAFSTGQDLGTSPDDMLLLSRYGPFVHGCDPETGRTSDPGPYTARGVLAGICAAVGRVFGSDDLRDRSILLQGLGGVGRPLAGLCAEAGADLLLSDLDRQAAGRLAEELDGRCVDPEEVYSTECDVYAPCAVGATLSEETIPRLRCRIVAGSANNQLANDEDAGRLHDRGILYAPDYVINAGGALAFGLKACGETDETLIGERLDGLQSALEAIFEEAGRREESPLNAARRRVDRVLSAARSG